MCGNVFQSHTCEIPPHLLAISSGHNTQQREQGLQCLDSLDCSSAFIAAEVKGSLQCFSTANAALSLSVIFLPCFICFCSSHLILPSTHYLFAQLPILFTLSQFFSLPAAVLLYSHFSYFSLNFQLFLEYLSFLTPSNRSNSPSASDLDFPTPLHFVLPSQVCRQSFVYVNTTSIPKPFSLSLPKARTSSCFIPRWAQGETRKAV